MKHHNPAEPDQTPLGKLVLLACVAVLLGGLVGVALRAFADPATGTEVDVGILAAGAGAVVQGFNARTVLGLAALVNLATHIFRLRPIREWLVDHKKRWLISYIALGLGTLSGLLTGLSQGMSFGNAVMQGLMAGTMAIGTHEVIKRRKSAKRKA